MDSELLKGFIDEALSYFPEIREGISAYRDDSAQLEGLQSAKNSTQTVKGAALMIGLPEVGNLSDEIEKELQSWISNGNGVSAEDASSILGKIENLENVLRSAKSTTPDFDDEPLRFEFLDDDEEIADIQNLENAEQFDLSEDFEIDDEMMEVFAMEAEDHLQNISTNLTVLENAPNNRGALLEIRRSAHTLKGSAGIVGFKKLSTLAHRVEDLLDYLSDNEIEGDKKVFELLLASTDSLEALTRGQNTPELEQTIGDIYLRFDETMASLQKKEAAKVSAVSKSESAANNTSQVEIAQPLPAAVLEESADSAENPSQVAKAESRSVIRVSLDRLDHLVKVVSEMVISRSIFEQRLIELEQQIQELNHTTNRLRRSTGKLEVDFEASTLGSKAAAKLPKFSFSGGTGSWLTTAEEEFDTLEFDQYTDFHQTTRELIETTSDTSAIHNDIDNVFLNLSLLFDSQRNLIEEMQDSLLRLRMVPLSSLSTRLHRAIRVTANEEGKQAELFLENEHIEIDTQILDAFVEPLIHLLRNAVAHGIEDPETRALLGKPEKGRISLRGYSEGTHIVFVISDDGRGISIAKLKERALKTGFISKEEADLMSDEEALSLIFLPGLSTSSEINQVSGRGVGMNIVKSSISRWQGNIFISSEPQQGTTFTIRLPMSLAVTRALLVKAEDQTFALPLKLIKKVVEVSPEELDSASNEKIVKFDGKSYKLFHFNSLLNLPMNQSKFNPKTSILLLETPDKPCALMVDELIKTEEIVIKPLGSMLRDIPDIIGATILGNGNIIPVLDLVYLLKKKPSKDVKPKPVQTETKSQISVLIVDDSPSVRQMNSNLVKNAGWIPILAKDGVEALELLQSFRELPDIILTDVEMPRMDGYEFLASLRRNEQFRSLPVIMITSRAGGKHSQKAFDLGVSAYFSKPFEEISLIEKVKELVGASS